LITPSWRSSGTRARWFIINGHLPVFTHGVEDLASFRLFTSQLIINGTATQGQINQAFGVPAN